MTSKEVAMIADGEWNVMSPEDTMVMALVNALNPKKGKKDKDNKDKDDLTPEEKQKRYYHELYEWAGRMNITTFFFEAFDENWKGDPNNPLGAEKHWGLFYADRKPKLALRSKR